MWEMDNLLDFLEGVLKETHWKKKGMVCVKPGKYSRCLYAFTTERYPL